MKYLKKFESPNTIKVGGETIQYYNDNNIAFLYSNEGDFYYGNDTHHDVCYNNNLLFAFNESGMKRKMKYEGHEYGNDNEPEHYVRGTEISGRIFPEHNVLTFWTYPETYEEYEKVLKDIEINTDIKFDDTWRLELPRGKSKKSEGGTDDYPGKLIPLYDYEGGAKRNAEEMKIVHLMSPEEKEEHKKTGWGKGVGSDHKDYKSVEFRHALGKFRGESMIIKFNLFII